jgi:hypothetical protein
VRRIKGVQDPQGVAAGLGAQFPHLRKAGGPDLRTEGETEIGAAFHQKADASIDFSLLGFGQGVPPLFEFICEFDFPYRVFNIAWMPYGVGAIVASTPTAIDPADPGLIRG